MSATNRMTGTVRTKQACVGSRDRTHRSLRYRPEDMNTIGALAESDASEHAPLAEPIWTTTLEEYGLARSRW